MVLSKLIVKFGTGHNFGVGILSKEAQNRLLRFLKHHLKDLSLSFQKIALLDQRN